MLGGTVFLSETLWFANSPPDLGFQDGEKALKT